MKITIIQIILIAGAMTASIWFGIALALYLITRNTDRKCEHDNLDKTIEEIKDYVRIQDDALAERVQQAMTEFADNVIERNEQVTKELTTIKDLFTANENTLKHISEVEKLGKEIEEEEFSGVEKSESPSKFINYGDFIIEDYGGYYLVFDPRTSERKPKMYDNVNKAMAAIDSGKYT